MPFTDGVFANVAGASNADAGQIIQSVVWNNIHEDYSEALNELMSQLLNTSSLRNLAWMNGGFEVWQRGAGAGAFIDVPSSVSVYTADRWYALTGTDQDSGVSAQTGLSDESRLCARVQRKENEAGVTVMRFAYPFDTDEIYRARGNIISVSFRVRAGANWSPTSGTLSVNVYAGTGAVGKRGASSYTSETTVISSSTNLTTTTALFDVTSSVVVPATTTQMELQVSWTPVGTAGAADYFEIDDVQIEPNLGTEDWTISNYDRVPFPTMLEGCKRHYQKSFDYGVHVTAGAGATNALAAMIGSAAPITFFWVMSPELRTTPGVTTYNPVTATNTGWRTDGSSNVTASVNTGITGSKGVVIQSANSVSADSTITIHAIASAGI